MTSSQIRSQFIEFFKNKDHRYVPSAPVVPYDDPTLLFTNAGMNQFKDVFLNTGAREYKRAANTQKCIRVSGKHNDLEEVGYDTYHHTFFEMLGNWSFGDYYKREAISWAWELLTEVWKLPKERLFATVYRTDDEAMSLWKEVTDIKHSHILKFDEKDNFWEMGETGPCGPCSEIHINLTDNFDDGSIVNAGTADCIEIWNLVFIQYNRDEKGVLHELPAKHVDTGMGFERVCAVIQNKSSNYDTDVFAPLLNGIEKLSGVQYGVDEIRSVAMRVIADHIRTLSFAIADGAVPGNDGRGYVLRRLLRRASRYARKLNLNEPFLFKLVEIIASSLGEVFPEVVERKEYIQKIIKSEEESFNRTLDRGIELFDKIVKKLHETGSKVIDGGDAFKLYDTFGFPVDLTAVMARELGLDVDEIGFDKLMTEQKGRAREATKQKMATLNILVESSEANEFSGDFSTVFAGYEQFETFSKIVAHRKEGHTDLIALDITPFYVESGGQIDDVGSLKIGELILPVADLLKINNKIVHVIENPDDFRLIEGMDVCASIDKTRRWDIMRNHTATHFLHTAMRRVLGSHVHQSGSYVGIERLRFDFTHFSKLSYEEISEIESIVNNELRKNIPLQHHRNTPIETAQKMGALMFFGDKYGDLVNIVQFGDFSMEFCGGTHVKNSSEIGLFKIIAENSIASGIRRIEAVTGHGVEKYIINQSEKIKEADYKILELSESKKRLEKEIADFKLKEKLGQIPAILGAGKDLNNIKLYSGVVNADNIDEMKFFGDELRNKMFSGTGILIARFEEKVGLVCVVSDDLVKEKKLNAGKIVGDIARLLGGSGGGRAHLATAGAKDAGKIDEALEQFPVIVKSYFS